MNLGDAVLHFKGDSKDLEEKTSGLGTTLKNTLGGVGKTVAGVFATATVTATAMVTSLTKKAMNSYADLEQNVGGVETLFKQSADRVIENSKKAYKTAGLSANQYMETVTSFSASLLQSLEGDTEKATDYADQAIIDMSDNANKMGTDMSMIQSAYQGFAKQNYTMLDNLKLGYGGTKTEMERLIADANRVKEANGEMANLSIDSFADITEAIHVIQTEMGITGTTSEEAEKTITGSINAMKGAFDNFLNGSGSVDDLISSIITAFGNLSDAFIEILPNLIDGLVGLIEALIPKIPEIVQKVLPTLLKGIIELAKAIIKALPDFINVLIEGAVEIANTLAEELPTLIPMIVDALLQGLLALLENIDVMIEAGIKLVLGLIQGLINAIPKIIENLPKIIQALITGLIEALPQIIAMGPQIIISLITGLIQAIPQLIMAIPDIVMAIVNGLIDGLSSIFDVGAEMVSSLWDGIKSMFSSLWEWIKELPSNILTWIKDGLSTIGEIGMNLVKGLWDGIKSVKDWIWGKISGFFSGIVDGIKNFFGIGSPSKLFADEIGQWLPKGLAVGIDANTDSVDKAIENMNDIVASSFDLQPDISTLGSTYSPNTIVNVQNNMELDPLGQLVNNVKTFSGGAKNDYNWGAGV